MNNSRIAIIQLLLIIGLIVSIGCLLVDGSALPSSLSETLNNETIHDNQQLDWQYIDSYFNMECNVTAQCGRQLICVNGTCQGCQVDGEDECNDHPYVICKSANVSVPIGNSSLFENHIIGLCDTKSLFPISVWDILATFFSSFGGIAAAASGVGGGGVYVPVMFLIGRYPAQVSVALSTVMIFGASTSVYLMLIPKRHPFASGRPLIDYHAALITEPIILAGSIVGVFLNVWFPNWFLTILLLAILLFVAWRSIVKGRQQWKKENEERKKKEEAKNKPTVTEEDTAQIVESKEVELNEEVKETAPNEAQTPVEVETTETPKENLDESLVVKSEENNKLLERIKKLELIAFPSFSWILLSISWIIVFVSSFLKGGKSFPSVVGVKRCSPEYWGIVGSSFPLLLGMSGIAAIYLRYLHHKKVQSNYEFLEGDIKWTTKYVTLIPLIFFIAGLVAGLLGIGGGLVVGPLLLEMGVNPLVSVATSSFTVLLTGSSTAIQFLIMGVVSWDYFIWYFVAGILSGTAGQIVVALIMKKFGRPSIIVFIIAIFIAISSVLTGAMGITSLVTTLVKGGNLGFNNIC